MLSLCLFTTSMYSQDFRSINGFGNNKENPSLGMAHGNLPRICPANYADGISTLDVEGKSNPRTISNIVCSQDDQIFDQMNLSDYVWVFGQFIDHDIVEVADGEEFSPIIVPGDDQFFTPGSIIPMSRSQFVEGTGSDVNNPRAYTNEITAFIDGSAIYGSSESVSNGLRSFQNGKLKVSEGNLLPWNTINGEFNSIIDPNAPFMASGGISDKLFLAGDARANENILLASMHTLFVREHNRICDELLQENPAWSDEIIFQLARKEVGAILQSIVYNEWLPAMGVLLPEYQGYDASTDPSVSNLFSAAAFRVGHTLLSTNIIRMNNEGLELGLGSLSLKDAFFNPIEIPFAGGIDPLLKGMAQQVQQKMDAKVVEDVRNFLFGSPDAGGLDLAAININRGRERGLPNYNDIRTYFGLPRLNSFAELTSDIDASILLSGVYDSIDEVDAWVGLVSEDPLNGTIFGQLLTLILEDQFIRLRDGDRYFYLNDPYFAQEKQIEISQTRLSDLVSRNTSLTAIQEDLFFAVPHEEIPIGPALAPVAMEAVAYPNPIVNQTTIKFYALTADQVTIRIMDSQGKTVQNFTVQASPGVNYFPVKMTDNQYVRGIYNVLVGNGINFTNLRVFKD